MSMILSYKDDTSLQILMQWLKQPGAPTTFSWVAASADEERRLRESAKFHIADLSPLYIAVTERRWDLAEELLALGANLQDEAEAGIILQRIFETGISHRSSLTLLKVLLQLSIAHRSMHIVTMDDVARLVAFAGEICGKVKWDYWHRLSWKDTESPVFPYPGHMTGLWAYVMKASQHQRQSLSAANEDPTTSHLLYQAACQSDLVAVRCLLDLGFRPNGTGDTTPLDVVQWTSCIPDHYCSASGLRLKQINQAISDLLRGRGGTTSTTCSLRYQVAVVPWLEIGGVLEEWRIYVLQQPSGALAGAMTFCGSIGFIWFFVFFLDLGGLYKSHGWLPVIFFSPILLAFIIHVCHPPLCALIALAHAVVLGAVRASHVNSMYHGSYRASWAAALGRENRFRRFLIWCLFPGRSSRRGGGGDRLRSRVRTQNMIQLYESIVTSAPEECEDCSWSCLDTGPVTHQRRRGWSTTGISTHSDTSDEVYRDDSNTRAEGVPVDVEEAYARGESQNSREEPSRLVSLRAVLGSFAAAPLAALQWPLRFLGASRNAHYTALSEEEHASEDQAFEEDAWEIPESMDLQDEDALLLIEQQREGDQRRCNQDLQTERRRIETERRRRVAIEGLGKGIGKFFVERAIPALAWPLKQVWQKVDMISDEIIAFRERQNGGRIYL